MKRTFLTVIVVIAGLACALWLTLAGHKESNAPGRQFGTEKKPPLVAVKPAIKQDMESVVRLTGVIEPTKVAVMASPAEGPVVECFVREGDIVAKNQTLVLVGRKYGVDAAVRSALEELNKQKDEFDRIRRLVEGGAVPGDQLDIAKANLEQARAALASAETQAADYKITAPWDGIVARVWIAEGNYVSPRANLVEIFSPQSLVLRFAVPEAHSGQVQKGAPLEVRIDAYAGQVFQGEVIRVYPELDRTTRTQTVEADIVNNPKLVPGMFARIGLTTDHVRDATTVPVGAVLANPKGESLVFVFQEGKARVRKVKTGIEREGFIQIIEGVNPGELVVVAGNETLKDGAAVRISASSASSGPEIGKGAHP